MLPMNWELYFQNSQTPASCSPPPFSRHFCLFWFWATSNFNATRYHWENQDKLVQKVHKNRESKIIFYLPIWDFLHACICFVRGSLPILCEINSLSFGNVMCSHGQSVSNCCEQTPTVVNILLYFIIWCLYCLLSK